MSSAERIKSGRAETKGDVAVLGSSLAIGGLSCSSCAFFSVIGIPALIITLPLSLLGIVLLGTLPFLKTKNVKCPKCTQENHVLTRVKAFRCKECGSLVTFNAEGKPKL